jgi:hypothetical protein
MPSSFEEVAPYGYAWKPTPDDNNDLVKHTRAIQVGGAGNVAVLMYDPATDRLTSVTLVGLIAGQIITVRTKRILATGTTATNITALA